MYKTSIFTLLILLFLTQGYTLAGEVYKTKDSKGDIKYTNVKPAKESEKVLETIKYSHREAEKPSKTDPLSYEDEVKIKKEKQHYTDEVFRERAKLLYEKEKSLEKDIKNTKIYIDDLKNVIDDYLINGYFADNYIFELRIQESNLESLNSELAELDSEWDELKKEARKNNVEPGVLRVD